MFLLKRELHGTTINFPQQAVRNEPVTDSTTGCITLHESPEESAFTPNCYSGSVISAAKMPGSLARVRYPSYLSASALTRFMPSPWLPRFVEM